jgi:hypothetical protein
VVIATTHGCHYVQRLLGVLLPRCEKIDAEVWLADASGNGLPDSLGSPSLRYLPMPGASVFQLRAAATAQASGEIVAWTEDHCLPDPDWCERILEAHQRHPETQVIGGAVANGTGSTSLDCANFLCTFGAFIEPMRRPLKRRAPPVANLSFKRNALPPGAIRPGFIEMVFCAAQLRAGHVVFDDHIRVLHFQSWQGWDAFESHFHNGRSTTGLLVEGWPLWKRARQTLISLLMPAEVTWTAITNASGKPQVQWMRHVPLIIGLALAFGAGEFVGSLRGAGRSPNRLV